MDDVNRSIEVIGDLAKFKGILSGKINEKDGVEEEIATLRKEQSRLENEIFTEQKSLQTKEEEVRSIEKSINEALDNVVAVTKNKQTLAGKDGWFQLNVAKSSLEILNNLMKMKRDFEILETGKFDRVALTSLVANAVSCQDSYMHSSPAILEIFKRHKALVEKAVTKEMKDELSLLGWSQEPFFKPSNFQYLSACMDWMVSLKLFDRLAEIFFEPFRKKFVYHFLESATLTKPELFHEVVKSVLGWMTVRFEFLIKLQDALEVKEGSLVRDFVKQMTELLIIRAKKDLSKVANENSRVFLDIVDEIFVWSTLVEQHFDYVLTDGNVPHLLIAALMPSENAVVMEHWLGLEKSVAENVLREKKGDLEALFSEIQTRTDHRLKIIPFPWQRKKFMKEVMAVLFEGKKKEIVDELESAMIVQTKKERKIWLTNVNILSQYESALRHWSVMPEYGEDDDLLLRLWNECCERRAQDINRFAQVAKLEFLEALDDWFQRNWLYVSEKRVDHLMKDGDSRFDLSNELCEPYEKLRENVRIAMKCLGEELFTEMALSMTEQMDVELLEMLLDFAPLMSVELARQMEFDSSLVFGIFSSISSKPALLFKRFSEALTVLLLDENTLIALKCLEQLQPQEQLVVLEKYGLKNLSAENVLKVCELRKDME